ncbi:MAG: hypothetical protein HY22_07120 [[Candidatus Thermochlorobacteriaceae] bacterium GBChlB]|nr:MAG: hypothetical protein HY22_07120 [[Candidatus Thermochlorobacteriaceae] bacterium GBChlB]
MQDIGSAFGLTLIALSGAVVLIVLLPILLGLKQFNRLTYAPYPLWIWGIIGTLGVIGLTLVLSQSSELHERSLRKKWPTVQGKIDSTVVVGKRGFLPIVVYRYAIDGKEYTSSAELYSPQFGGKNMRKETSERIASAFESGKDITVYYNPLEPSESCLETNLRWDMFIRLGVGLFLYVGAIGAALEHLLRKILLALTASVK